MNLVTLDQNILQQENQNIECTDEFKKKSSIYKQYKSDFFEKKK